MQNKLTFLIIILQQIFQLVFTGHIYSWDPQIQYNSEGFASNILLHFSLDSGLPQNQLIHLQFPFEITTNDIQVYEYSQEQLAIQQTQVIVETTQSFLMEFQQEFEKLKWYTIDITIENEITAGFYLSPVRMYTRSNVLLVDLDHSIIYDLNPSFTQLNIQKPPKYVQITIKQTYETNDTSQKTGFGQLNFVFFDITPSLPSPNGAIFYIEILEPEFTFGDTCTSIRSTDYTEIEALDSNLYECTSDPTKPNRIKLVINTAVEAQIFRIKALVVNPYIAKRSGYKVYYYEKKGNQQIGQIKATQSDLQPVFQTLAIEITQYDFKVLWGFRYTGSNSQVLRNLYVSDESVDYYVYNNLYFDFSISSNSPSDTVNSYYKVKVRVQHDTILDGSITHNLLAAKDKNIVCNSVKADPEYYIVCNNVGSLVGNNVYYISAKVVYLSTHTFDTDATNKLEFGKIEIIGVTESIDSATDLKVITEDTTLFNSPLQQITLSSAYFQQATSLIATDGTAGFQKKLGNTQVISVPELDTDSVTDLWAKVDENSNAIQYIPEVQSIIFLLEADHATICGTDADCTGANSITHQQKMELYFNHNAIKFEQGQEESGLQLAAYDGTGTAVLDGASCSRNAEPQCVDYTSESQSLMNEEAYNYKELFQKDGDVPSYGQYTFYCGNNGQTIDADGTLCIFDGKISTTDLENNVLIMRNTQLSTQFTMDSFYSYNENQLDFVLAFYSGQMDCNGDPCQTSQQFALASVSVIHGYTLSKTSGLAGTEWDNLYINFVNYWLENDGSAVPTYFRVKGTFDQSVLIDHNSIGVFFDSTVSLSFSDDYDNTHQYFCAGFKTTSTYDDCEAIVGTSLEQTANWRNSNGVIFKNFQMDSTNEIDLYIPVETGTLDPIHLTIVLFNYNQNSVSQKQYFPKAVYKIHGTRDLSTDLDVFITNTDANIAAAVTRIGTDASGGQFQYGIEAYDITTETLQFTPTVTGGTNTNIDFTSQVGSGAGLTIISKSNDIFEDQQLKLNLDTAGDFPCYKIQYLQDSYSVFCPLENPVTTINAATSDIGLNIIRENFPISFFVENLFYYGLSGGTGLGLAVNSENKQVSPAVAQTCTLGASPQILNSVDLQQQFFILPITVTNPIPIDPENILGTSFIQIEITFTVGSSSFDLDDFCQVDNQHLQCTFLQNATPPTAQIIVQNGIDITSISQFNLKLVLLGNKSLDASITYAVDIKIGNSIDGTTTALYGDQLDDDNIITWETCTGGTIDCSGTAPDINVFFLDDTLQLESNYKGVGSELSLKFGPGLGRLTLYYGEYIELVMGWAIEGQDNNYRCIIEQDDGEISYEWEKIDSTTTAGNFHLYPSQDINITDPPQIYVLRCIGSQVPTPTVSTDISITWKNSDGSLSIQTSDSTIAQSTDLVAVPPALTVTMVKKFATPGQNSNYIFTITAGTSLSQQSQIYLFFSDDQVSPKLNTKYGRVECEIDDVRVTCNFVSERRLEIWIPQSYSSGDDLILTVQGLTIHAYDAGFASKNVWIGISSSGSYLDAIDQSVFITETEVSQTAKQFPVVSASITPNQIRTKIAHIINTEFPLGKVVKDKKFYIDILSTPYSQLWSPLCRVERVNDNSFYNWVKNCEFINSERLQLTFKSTDTNSTLTVQEYKIEISNGPSPAFYEFNSAKNSQRYKLLFASDTTQEFVTDISYYESELALLQYEPSQQLKNLGFKFMNADFTEQEFNDNSVTVYKGYYSSIIELQSYDTMLGLDIFSSIITIALTGIQTTYFEYYPSQFQSQINPETNPQMKLGAKIDTFPGPYTIETFKSGTSDSQYVKIPPVIKLQVVSKSCDKLRVNSNDIKVPKQGSTSELKVYFNECFPIDDITIIPNLPTNDAFTISDEYQILQSDGFERYMAQFTVTNISTDVPAGSSQTITWSFSGTNAEYYDAPEDVNISFSIYDFSEVNPVSTLTLDPQQVQGQISFTMECDQDSLAFYTAYAEEFYENKSTYTEILDSLENGYFEYVQPQQNDNSYQVYGSKFVKKQISQNIIINDIKLGAKYNIEMYCKNNYGLISEFKQQTLQTIDNSDKNVKLTITLTDKITASQQSQLLCAISEILVIESELIVTQNGIKCATVQTFSNQNNFKQNDLPATDIIDIYFLKSYKVKNSLNYQKAYNLRIENTEFKENVFEKMNLQVETYPQINTIQYSNINNNIVKPILKISSMQSSFDSATISFNILNTDGFVLFGVDKYLYSETIVNSDLSEEQKTVIAKKPSISQLFYSRDGKNQNKLINGQQYIQQGEQASFTITGLESSQEYILYFTSFSGENCNPENIYNSGMQTKLFLSVPSDFNEMEGANASLIISFKEIAYLAIFIFISIII